jgi:hypothetical protein
MLAVSIAPKTLSKDLNPFWVVYTADELVDWPVVKQTLAGAAIAGEQYTIVSEGVLALLTRSNRIEPSLFADIFRDAAGELTAEDYRTALVEELFSVHPERQFCLLLDQQAGRLSDLSEEAFADFCARYGLPVCAHCLQLGTEDSEPWQKRLLSIPTFG